MVILGIDPSLRGTGFGIISGDGKRWKALGYGVIKNPPSLKVSSCLARIHEKTKEICIEFKPDACAIEGVFYMQNFKISITLGAARGAAIAACASCSIPIFEYAPRKVKQSVAGTGAAGKSKVNTMIRALLGLREEPPADAADALAIALTHTNQLQGISLNQAHEI
ncbi:crossover junction endodeoxyribonuclease RuvC [Kamptonema cortianum]|uniref:Crossover junction endodeoxyribonuclease RuvC n=1 Tax=Geitlerinema calcuttense NRMC-F 0142 TaxID=2922238 RepID=A0ABT7M095_9CYAN|nr:MULTISPECIES: crossover junction endodeoxyribonuclease RuvC [Cyanophyceae]MDK3156614.1 crossover junction endodeoxyribonuclease RuvC [Kamptonema cortianum]MDL5050375.1 crossover junction endodeoxyribonuclease RuvC [Oscillatoria amoena NRMC-F 0135]MDL5054228.1 crossover junction endodeoxyribonuclease RuvC [Oscillatoria laete-virens NRMC-F 0139]MDL5057479.1 crossover junction endodeoxyribonuclease RuvC [Geitlerinema calcuttense NRMC-F 0142]